eukprot:3647127-Pyramimonas_sp.AAC.1
MKGNPMSPVTHQLKLPAKLVTVGDAAFRREPADKGLVMSGAVYLLVEDGEGPGGKLNMLEYCSGKQAHVVRSIWGAGLRHLSDGCDYLLLLAGVLVEIQMGEMSVRQSRGMVGGAESCMLAVPPLEACVDAQSVFSGITAGQVKMQAERHALYHAQWIRELLDRAILRVLWWTDTRDCCAY